MPSLRLAIVVALASVLTFVVACGASDESYYYQSSNGDSYSESLGLDHPGLPAALSGRDDSDDRFAVTTVVVERAVNVEKEVMKEVMVESEMMMDESAMMMSESATAVPQPASQQQLGQNVNISIQPQNRIIVRNADMRVEADDPIAAVDDIGDLAVARGGWVVNINTIDEGGFYYITIRIPAETLDAVIEQITADVAKVLSVSSDSTDFTEEYIDLGARRSTVQETVDALTELLRSENYNTVQELLEVQREITNWQSELESIDGRLAFISESAAFSRLSVTVNRSPIPMRVDVADDVHVGIGVGRKYTARFFPPDGYDRFEIIWDFGDGSPAETVYSGLRTQGDDGYLSVPVRHTYHSDELSPHVVTATVRAFSDRGLAEGEDQLWANVSELPRIDAFISAAEGRVEEGEPVSFTASFNHPETLRDVKYAWDFRDGTPVEKGTVASGVTGIEIEHIFERFRPGPYEVVFEIRGNSDAGEVMETIVTHIWVNPAPSVDAADFNPGNTATSAANVLIDVIAFAGTAGIWLAITSPIWLILGAIIFFIVRFIKRRQRNVQRVIYVPNTEEETPRDSGTQPTSATTD